MFNTKITSEDDYGVQTSYLLHLFFIFSLLCSYYANDIIKKMNLPLLVVLILVFPKLL